jgi:hypothetical protein
MNNNNGFSGWLEAALSFWTFPLRVLETIVRYAFKALGLVMAYIMVVLFAVSYYLLVTLYNYVDYNDLWPQALLVFLSLLITSLCFGFRRK